MIERLPFDEARRKGTVGLFARHARIIRGLIPVRDAVREVIRAQEQDEPFGTAQVRLPVEAIRPAGVLRQFRVTLDYAAPSLTLAPPSDLLAPGVAVPVQVNEGTGLISAEAEVGGRRYPVVIDAGAGYTWWRGDLVRGWLADHPEWLRADGAPGRSNQAMVEQAFEQQGTLVRVPIMALGALQLRDVGLLGSGPARITYWQEVEPPRTDELDGVGLSWVHTPTEYRVGGIVHRAGLPDVGAAVVGDRLIAVDGRNAATMTRGTLLDALAGMPGQNHRLSLDRDGQRFEVDLPVNAY
ncbi:hypothetical protein [Roseomonas gilardii]|uniref:hypothetical protein n=1 Tax=Roseomonas gilardii TaxID=257708 RepID=UPI001643D23B|nr:hypothetical protein [Roseomonas gilardii]